MTSVQQLLDPLLPKLAPPTIETGPKKLATMSTSSKDVFRCNPPRILTVRDWVIRASMPRIPRDKTEDFAKTEYPRTRLKRLIRTVEARLGKNRCFFNEWQPKDKKKDSQFEVTKLYALYEVEHWPGALDHYEWTQFVIANMERDGAIEDHSRYERLARK